MKLLLWDTKYVGVMVKDPSDLFTILNIETKTQEIPAITIGELFNAVSSGPIVIYCEWAGWKYRLSEKWTFEEYCCIDSEYIMEMLPIRYTNEGIEIITETLLSISEKMIPKGLQ